MNCAICQTRDFPRLRVGARNPLKLPKGTIICARCFDQRRKSKWGKSEWVQRALCSILLQAPDKIHDQ